MRLWHLAVVATTVSVVLFVSSSTAAGAGSRWPRPVAGGSAGTSCGDLPLILRPGPVHIATAENGPPARDIPPAPVIQHLPLYPGSAASSLPTSLRIIAGVFPPAYRKSTQAEFLAPAGYRAVEFWYRSHLGRCGYVLSGIAPLLRRYGFRQAGLEFRTRGYLKLVAITFLPLSAHQTLTTILTQVADLPPRPLTSYLHGHFIGLGILFYQQGLLPGTDHTYLLNIGDPAIITRLQRAINRPYRIYVAGIGPLVGDAMPVTSATLMFTGLHGASARVFVGGVLDRIVVNHTRPLVDPNRHLITLVSRIVLHRCPGVGCVAIRPHR